MSRVIDQDYDSFYAIAASDEINSNNSEEANSSPYFCFDLTTNVEVKRPTTAELKGKPICDLCFVQFSSFSLLYKHKGKLCFEDAVLSPPFPHPVHIYFLPEQLLYVSDCLSALGLEVKEREECGAMFEECKEKTMFVEVDYSMCEVTMRRLYVAQITKYNLEGWYPALHQRAAELGLKKGFTAHTLMLELSDEELHTIKRWCSIQLSENMNMPSRPTNEEMKNREDLEDKITKMISDDQQNQKIRMELDKEEEEGKKEEKTEGLEEINGGYFLKFSTRAPKDAISIDPEDASLPLSVQIAKKIRKLRINNGAEAISLLSKSQRIFSDISMFFQYRVKGSTSGRMALLLRDWVECAQDHEFRCFVHNRQLNAISQYHCYSYFDKLQDPTHIEKIREAIEKCFESVKDCFPLPSFVIDIAVNPNTYECYIIELNPFGKQMSSGSALFHWERDGEMMYGNIGRKQPCIRILKELLPDEGKKE